MRVLTAVLIFGASLSFLSLIEINADAGLLEPHLQRTSLPECHENSVLEEIAKQFNKAEKETWHRGLYLSGITRLRERKLLASEERLVNRRYCRGMAIFDGSRKRPLFYLIEEGQGFAGWGWAVEYCVNGLDPWREYDGSCRVLNH